MDYKMRYSKSFLKWLNLCQPNKFNCFTEIVQLIPVSNSNDICGLKIPPSILITCIETENYGWKSRSIENDKRILFLKIRLQKYFLNTFGDFLFLNFPTITYKPLSR